MKIKPDRKCQYVETGSRECASLVRVSRDPWLRIELQAEQARLRAAWSEAQHVKSVKALEREAEIRHRARERELFWFRVKAENWGEEKGQGSKASTSSRAIRIAKTQGWMPHYPTPIRTAQGLLFPFQRTIYRNAKSSAQGAAKHLVRYGADGAHEFNDGSRAFFSSVGQTVDEAAEAFDQLERANRTAAANAKVVHHMIIQSLHELSPEEQWAMLLRYCDHVFGSQDLPYSVCLHAPSEQGDQRNWHAHVVFSYRPMVRTDEAEWQIGRAIRTDLDCPEQWTRMRYLLCEEFNRTAEAHGINKRYTHLSYAASGLDYIPQAHLGAGLTAKVRRGERVELNDRNSAVVARNSALQAVRELRNALRASAASLSAIARRRRDTIRAVAAIWKAKAEQASSFDLRGVRVPTMQTALGDSEINAANDDIAVRDQNAASFKLPTAPLTPTPLEMPDNTSNGTSDLAHSAPPILPEDPMGPDELPTILTAKPPSYPDELTKDEPPEPIWTGLVTTPILPIAFPDDDEDETPSAWSLNIKAPGTQMIPVPIETPDTEVEAASVLAAKAPLLPVSMIDIMGDPPAFDLEATVGANATPTLPDQLPQAEMSDSIWEASFKAPLIPMALLADDEDQKQMGWPFGMRASAPTTVPEPIKMPDTEVADASWSFATAPKLSISMAEIAEASLASWLNIRSIFQRPTQLPKGLESELPASSRLSVTRGFDGRALIVPNGQLSGPSATRQNAFGPVPTIPREPADARPRNDVGVEFSGLKQRRPEEPANLVDSPNSDEQNRSTTVVRNAKDPAKLQSFGKNEKHRKPKVGGKSSWGSLRSKRSLPWPFGNDSNGLE
jgi:hypothetical protein